MIELENLKEHLKTISLKEWKELFVLLPNLEEVRTLEMFSNKVMNIIYDLNIIPVFDWGNWSFGRKVLDNKNFDYSTLDKIELCKILTFIVRADRFNEGYLDSCFEDSTIQKILINLKKEVEK